MNKFAHPAVTASGENVHLTAQELVALNEALIAKGVALSTELGLVAAEIVKTKDLIKQNDPEYSLDTYIPYGNILHRVVSSHDHRE